MFTKISIYYEFYALNPQCRCQGGISISPVELSSIVRQVRVSSNFRELKARGLPFCELSDIGLAFDHL